MEERKDPMGLWVGSWTPEELLKREALRRETKEQVPEETDPRQDR